MNILNTHAIQYMSLSRHLPAVTEPTAKLMPVRYHQHYSHPFDKAKKQRLKFHLLLKLCLLKIGPDCQWPFGSRIRSIRCCLAQDTARWSEEQTHFNASKPVFIAFLKIRYHRGSNIWQSVGFLKVQREARLAHGPKLIGSQHWGGQEDSPHSLLQTLTHTLVSGGISPFLLAPFWPTDRFTLVVRKKP